MRFSVAGHSMSRSIRNIDQELGMSGSRLYHIMPTDKTSSAKDEAQERLTEAPHSGTPSSLAQFYDFAA